MIKGIIFTLLIVGAVLMLMAFIWQVARHESKVRAILGLAVLAGLEVFAFFLLGGDVEEFTAYLVPGLTITVSLLNQYTPVRGWEGKPLPERKPIFGLSAGVAIPLTPIWYLLWPIIFPLVIMWDLKKSQKK